MPRLDTIEASKTSRVLIFGPPKTGKTEIVGNLSEFFELEWFDLENGYETLLKLPVEWKKRINIHSLPDTRSYPIAIETMLKVIKGGEVKFCDEHGKVNCPKCTVAKIELDSINVSTLPANKILVIDSLTQLTNSCIAHITRGKPDDYKLEYDDWGNLGKLMDIILSHIQQAGYNVVCISHEMEIEQEDGKHKIVPVAGTRNFSRGTAKYFDHVVYASVLNKKHAFGSATDYAMNIVTGSRTDVKIEKLDKPSLLPIFQRHITADVNTNSQGLQAIANLQGMVK